MELIRTCLQDLRYAVRNLLRSQVSRWSLPLT